MTDTADKDTFCRAAIRHARESLTDEQLTLVEDALDAWTEQLLSRADTIRQVPASDRPGLMFVLGEQMRNESLPPWVRVEKFAIREALAHPEVDPHDVLRTVASMCRLLGTPSDSSLHLQERLAALPKLEANHAVG